MDKLLNARTVDLSERWKSKGKNIPSRLEVKSAYSTQGTLPASKSLNISRRDLYELLNWYKIPIRSGGQATKLRYDKQPLLTGTAFQLALGSLLGDASICRSSDGRSWTLAFAHGTDQKDYLAYKRSIIGGCKIYERPEGSNFGKPVFQFQFKNRPALEQIAALVQHPQNGRKLVNQRWIDELNDEGFSFWYQDDGSLVSVKNSWSVRFYTNSFSQPEITLLQEALLQRYGLKTGTTRGNSDNERIIFGSITGQVKTFVQRMKVQSTPCMEYKFRCLQ